MLVWVRRGCVTPSPLSCLVVLWLGFALCARVVDLDPRCVMEHIELLLLVIDELVDGGYVQPLPWAPWSAAVRGPWCSGSLTAPTPYVDVACPLSAGLFWRRTLPLFATVYC